ncbi:ABC transporter permease [Salipaludibacillus agaradhaerens]|uniref:ABC transporter permease n=1 Tax=Salipaludibacillus agaradhaerens TaxID=76935 RepID=UPI0014761B21|nr:ABC transporter permease [Salipaludibacillus agaradhaerens]
MNFYQLATKNVLRNLRSYLGFYFSSSFAVMVFYMFAMFVFHPTVESSTIGKVAQSGMKVAEWIIYLFSIFFVLYSVRAFMRTRKKEFGVLLIMGISQRQLNLLLTTENMIIGVGSIVSGIVGGTILAKMFFAVGAYMIEMREPLTLYLPWKAMGLTAGVFLPLFFVISRILLLFIRTEKIAAFLQGSTKSRRATKPSVPLSLLGSVLFSISYLIMFLTPLNDVVIILLLLIILSGIYFFFNQISVWPLHLLKKNNNTYLKGVSLLTTTDLANRLKDNTRLLSIVTVISTVAFVTTGVLATDQSDEIVELVENAIFEIDYYSIEGNEKEAEHLELIKSTLQESGFDYDLKIMDIGVSMTYENFIGFVPLRVISERELKKHLPNHDIPTLDDNEGVLYLDYWNARWNQAIPEVLNLLDSSKTVKVQQVKQDTFFNDRLLVVNDQTYKQFREDLVEATMYGFTYPNWKESLDEIERLLLKVEQNAPSYDNEYYIYSKTFDYFIISQVPSLHLFICLFVVVVFCFAAGSFLYFRVFTDLQDESEKYKALFKIGLTEREMRKSMTLQLAILFFLPFLVAAILTICVMVILWKYEVWDAIGPTLKTIAGFMVLQLLGFTIVRQLYLKKIMELIDTESW